MHEGIRTRYFKIISLATYHYAMRSVTPKRASNSVPLTKKSHNMPLSHALLWKRQQLRWRKNNCRAFAKAWWRRMNSRAHSTCVGEKHWLRSEHNISCSIYSFCEICCFVSTKFNFTLHSTDAGNLRLCSPWCCKHWKKGWCHVHDYLFVFGLRRLCRLLPLLYTPTRERKWREGSNESLWCP